MRGGSGRAAGRGSGRRQPLVLGVDAAGVEGAAAGAGVELLEPESDELLADVELLDELFEALELPRLSVL